MPHLEQLFSIAVKMGQGREGFSLRKGRRFRPTYVDRNPLNIYLHNGPKLARFHNRSKIASGEQKSESGTCAPLYDKEGRFAPNGANQPEGASPESEAPGKTGAFLNSNALALSGKAPKP